MAARGRRNRVSGLERRAVVRWTTSRRSLDGTTALQGGHRADDAGVPRDRRGADVRSAVPRGGRRLRRGAGLQGGLRGGRVSVRVSLAANWPASRWTRWPNSVDFRYGDSILSRCLAGGF